MTQAEIDSLLEAMHAHAVTTGEDADQPGLITFQRDEWVGSDLPTCCTSPLRGIRYRGIRVNISKDRETRVLTRGEALAAGEAAEPLEDLKNVADAKV